MYFPLSSRTALLTKARPAQAVPGRCRVALPADARASYASAAVATIAELMHCASIQIFLQLTHCQLENELSQTRK